MHKLKIIHTIKTAGRIYRDRFKEYYQIALINSFWLFVPIYGWAKYAAMMGLLARLAYGDVAGNPETITEAKRNIKPKTWLLFGAGLMETYIFYIKFLLFLIPLRIALLIAISTENVNILFDRVFWLLALICSFIYYFWLISRLFLYELPLILESNVNGTESRKRAWKISKHTAYKLVVIIFTFSCLFAVSSSALSTTIDISSSGFNAETIENLSNFSYLKLLYFLSKTLFACGALFIPTLSSAIDVLIKFFSGYFVSPNIDLAPIVFQFVIVTMWNFTIGALFVPLWQALKAVTYYQLSSTL